MQKNFIPLLPYQKGCDPENILEAIYVADIVEQRDHKEIIDIDVVFINSAKSFDYVQNLILQRKRGNLL